ncbi:hypothetical protein [Lysobacter gummosus]
MPYEHRPNRWPWAKCLKSGGIVTARDDDCDLGSVRIGDPCPA